MTIWAADYPHMIHPRSICFGVRDHFLVSPDGGASEDVIDGPK